MNNGIETVQQVVTVPPYPHKWANILNAPLNEGAISIYLEALYGAITNQFVPSPITIQSLLYLVLYPPTTQPHAPTPLSILYKIASLHPTASLMKYHTIPTYPRMNLDIPHWLNWEANGEVANMIKRRMRKCDKNGVWDLLWEQSESEAGMGVNVKQEKGRGKGRGGRKRRWVEDDDEDDDEEEEDEEGKGRKRISENGWIVLEWLVHIWENDEILRRDYSAAFLAQLPKQGDMQIDNSSLPLQVIYSVLDHPSTGEAQNRQENLAGRLLSLLVNTANPRTATATNSNPKPPFHPPSLPLSLLPLFRLPPSPLTKFLHIISSSQIPKSTSAHIIIHAIEDLTGTRTTKMEERRRHTQIQMDFEGIGNFPIPTIEYTLDILLLPPLSGVDAEERVTILKMVLISTMIGCTKAGDVLEKGKWEKGGDSIWREQLVSRLTGHGDVMDRMREVMIMMLDRVGDSGDMQTRSF